MQIINAIRATKEKHEKLDMEHPRHHHRQRSSERVPQRLPRLALSDLTRLDSAKPLRLPVLLQLQLQLGHLWASALPQQ
jgi:hypothetical protein